MAEVDAELPKALVKRIVKSKLSQLTGDTDKEFATNKDALTAFSESAKVFITYLAATANDICKEGKRQIVTADDVLKALEDIEFPEFIEPLKQHLEAFKAAAKEKAGAKKPTEGAGRKRKAAEGEEGADAQGEQDQANGDDAEEADGDEQQQEGGAEDME